MFLVPTSSLFLKINYEDLVLNILKYTSSSDAGGLRWGSGLVEVDMHMLSPFLGDTSACVHVLLM